MWKAHEPNNAPSATASGHLRTAADVWRIDFPFRPYLLQTNDDHWGPPADPRRQIGNELMQRIPPANYSCQVLYTQVLDVYPILNNLTTFSNTMSAALDSYWAVTQNNN